MSADEPSRVVRRPRYVPFLVTGFVLGVVATVLVVAFFGQQVDQPRRLTTYLGLLLGGLGALAGGALAVWLERNH
ncbi:MAG: hypothetical protein QOI54_632 [Actinomycetota bacterium]|nr:hypothetical protein [Actinomycetota bacterium]